MQRTDKIQAIRSAMKGYYSELANVIPFQCVELKELGPGLYSTNSGKVINEGEYQDLLSRAERSHGRLWVEVSPYTNECY